MTWLEKHFAALAERMIDAELVWQARRLPDDEQQSALQRAVKKEAERRFPNMAARP